jgi:hypothetical protein
MAQPDGNVEPVQHGNSRVNEMMRNHLLRVIRGNINGALEMANSKLIEESPNIKEVKELLDDALVEINIEIRKPNGS